MPTLPEWLLIGVAFAALWITWKMLDAIFDLLTLWRKNARPDARPEDPFPNQEKETSTSVLDSLRSH